MEKQIENFKSKIYGFQEIASLYSPEILPRSAARRLKRWILTNAKLYGHLTHTGWVEGQRLLTPNQVEVLVHYLGEP
ncbi:MAG: DUF4248 domain-containing protein [Tannerellaceae bacterium]|nr:DUF4248 domain-containing protein [Tannerellaceae bacterium]